MPLTSFTDKQRRFIDEYPVDFNATQTAIRAGYSKRTAYSIGQENLKKPEIAAAIAERIESLQMTAGEAALRMANAAKFDLSNYLTTEGRLTWLDVEKLKEDGYGWMIKGLKYTPKGGAVFELWDSQRALEKIFDNVNPSLGDKERPITISYIVENRPKPDDT